MPVACREAGPVELKTSASSALSMAAVALSGAVGAHETPSLHAPADGLSPTEGLALTVGVVVAPLHPTNNAAHRSEAISGGTIGGQTLLNDDTAYWTLSALE